MTVRQQLDHILTERIVVLDGAMGTMLQRHRLDEADFRGARVAGHTRHLEGNYDVLNLTRPDVVGGIHRQYLAAGADIIETNTFNSNAVSQSDYGLERRCYELNLEGARLARVAADESTRSDPSRPRFVAGAIGPTNRTVSALPDATQASLRAITFDDMTQAYVDQVGGLIDGGVDLLLLETVVDALGAKAALVALRDVQAAKGVDVPLMISFTIAGRGGRTLSGETIDAFYMSMQDARPWSIGINCAFGAARLQPHIAELSRVADCWVSAYPNAGLPNARGEYDETPSQTAALLRDIAESRFVNIVGGCCGTTPDHIARIAAAVADVAPRRISIRHSDTTER